MRKWTWAVLAAVPLAVAGGLGLAYANSPQAGAEGFVCPITGEELPCPKCCPLNQQQAQEQSYTCPITGEELPCPNCCPLNQSK